VLAVPSLANYTLAFALQLREKHGKTSVRVAKEIQTMTKLMMPFRNSKEASKNSSSFAGAIYTELAEQC
jgi:hypothetical protein